MPNYPALPDHRMPIHEDGTILVHIDSSNLVTVLDNAELQRVNDEDPDVTVQAIAGKESFAILFPELRDLTGYFFQVDSLPQNLQLEVSADTTNGVDGTWTLVSASAAVEVSSDVTAWRDNFTPVNETAIKGIRFGFVNVGSSDANFRQIHLYGKVAQGLGQDEFLSIWDPTLDQRLDPDALNFDDVPQDSSEDVTFRVKNLHGTDTATDVIVSVVALSDTTPSVAANMTLSTDGVNFASSKSLGNLAPGAISGVVTLRRNTPINAVLSTWAAWVKASANSWS